MKLIRRCKSTPHTVKYWLHPAKMRQGEEFMTGRIDHSDFYDTDGLVELMDQRGCTVQTSDSYAVIDLMTKVIFSELCRGNVIKLPFITIGLGLSGRFQKGEPFDKKKNRFTPRASFSKEFRKLIEMEGIIPERMDKMYTRVKKRDRKSTFSALSRLKSQLETEVQEDVEVAIVETRLPSAIENLNLPSAMEETATRVGNTRTTPKTAPPQAAARLVFQRLGLPAALEEEAPDVIEEEQNPTPAAVRACFNLPAAIEEPAIVKEERPVPMSVASQFPVLIGYDDYSLIGPLDALGGITGDIKKQTIVGQRNGKTKSPAKYKSRRYRQRE